MDLAVATWLTDSQANPWLDLASSYPDPTSLAAASHLRRHLSGDQAAAVLDQVSLRRRAQRKLGPKAASLFWTRDGLEQATRWPVATWRADHLVRQGARQLLDLGCGLGIDALAGRQAGLSLTGVERDPVTAQLARANLNLDPDAGPAATVITGDIEDLDLTPYLDDPTWAIFLDPARRTSRGRSWDVADLSPTWSFVETVLQQAAGPVVVKLGPGFPRRLLPSERDVTWVSHQGDLVETTLWNRPYVESPPPPSLEPEPPQATVAPSTPQRLAVLLPSGAHLAAGQPTPSPGPLGAYIMEPDPAVIRANGLGTLARLTATHPVAEAIAYLSGDSPTSTPFAQCFAIDQVLDYSEKALKAWVRAERIGVLEIKVRGLDLDPAVLRRRLQLRGQTSARLILTPTISGTKALVVRRLSD